MNPNPNVITFTLEGRPASKKNSRRIFTNKYTGKLQSSPSTAFYHYQSNCLDQITELKYTRKIPHDPITCPVFVQTHFVMGDDRKFDADNAHTSILDILQKAGVIENDSLVVHGEYVKVSRAAKWSTTIYITKLEEV